jgi:hypothetical protein
VALVAGHVALDLEGKPAPFAFQAQAGAPHVGLFIRERLVRVRVLPIQEGEEVELSIAREPDPGIGVAIPEVEAGSGRPPFSRQEARRQQERGPEGGGPAGGRHVVGREPTTPPMTSGRSVAAPG